MGLARHGIALFLQLRLGLFTIWIEDDAIVAAGSDALRFVEVSDALRALVRIDDENIVPFGDRVVRALVFAIATVNAVFCNKQSHLIKPRK